MEETWWKQSRDQKIIPERAIVVGFVVVAAVVVPVLVDLRRGLVDGAVPEPEKNKKLKVKFKKCLFQYFTSNVKEVLNNVSKTSNQPSLSF